MENDPKKSIDLENSTVTEQIQRLASIAGEIEEAEPCEADQLLIEALDEQRILRTIKTSFLKNAFAKTVKDLEEQKDRSLAQRMEVVRLRKRARRILLLAKFSGALIAVLFLFLGTTVWLSHEITEFRRNPHGDNLMAKSLAKQNKIAEEKAKSNQGPNSLEVPEEPDATRAWIFGWIGLGWLVGGIVARRQRKIGPYLPEFDREDLVKDVIVPLIVLPWVGYTWFLFKALGTLIFLCISYILVWSISRLFGVEDIAVAGMAQVVAGWIVPLLLVGVPVIAFLEFRKRR